MNLTQDMIETGKNRIKTVRRGEEGYLLGLEKLPQPPEKLYVTGELNEGPTAAIVGSRNADNGAIRFAFSLARDLARLGVCVVSGGALGIDTAAHKGALEGGGLTVCVLGAGFDFLYPPENKDLFSKIAENGALVSEFDPPQPPTKWTFPKRNRIVAALSDAVIVAQAKERSGALITAKAAMQIDVPVGAVPGVPQDPRNRGGHALLKRGAALLVEDADDVLSLISKPVQKKQMTLPGIKADKSPANVSPASTLTKAESDVLNYLGTSPLHIDEITAGLKLNPGETGAAILALELQGLIEDRGGRNFVRVG